MGAPRMTQTGASASCASACVRRLSSA
jgi:hypothetical protein